MDLDGNTIPEEWRIEVRPLRPIVESRNHYTTVSVGNFERWRASPEFEKTVQYFHTYPVWSLLSDESRAFLYHITKTLQPMTVIEIGTFFSGTAEIFARGLWENGKGILHTTDPNQAERCLAAIAQWPEELQDFVRFYGDNSMTFYEKFAAVESAIDIAFIDGNHDFEFAYFDLLSAARFIRRGGIIIMDNVEQSGPFGASMEFLRRNSEWTELGTCIADFDTNKPFGPNRCSVLNTSFLVLKAPEDYIVGSAVSSWGQLRVTGNTVKGIKLKLSRLQMSSYLHSQVILRAFSIGEKRIEEEKRDSIFRIGGDALQYDLEFQPPLVSKMHEREEPARYSVEILLSWHPRHGDGSLRLAEKPVPIM